MKNNIRIGVVGCGNISTIHLEAIKKSSNCELVMICDKDILKAKSYSKKYDVEYTNSYRKMLDREDIDSIHILTPHDLHVNMAIDALESNKHVLLEKPVGINLEELETLKKVAETTDKKITVSFQNRCNETSSFAKEIVESNELGRFIGGKGIVTWNRERDYYNGSDWKGIKSREGGGVLISQAIHTLDLIRYLVGDIESVKAMSDNTLHPYLDTEDSIMATLFHVNGGRTSFYATNNHGTDSTIEIELIFQNGSLKFSEDKLFYSKGNVQKIIKQNKRLDEKSYWGVSHDFYIDDFYNRIKQQQDPFISLNDAIITNLIVLNMYKSSELGKTIKINY